jgi:hypothetical protein
MVEPVFIDTAIEITVTIIVHSANPLHDHTVVIHLKHTKSRGTRKYSPVMRLAYIANAWIAVLVVFDRSEIVVTVVVHLQSSIRTNKKIAVFVYKKTHNNIVNHRRMFIAMMQIICKSVTIKFVETVFSTNPYISSFILTDTCDKVT